MTGLERFIEAKNAELAALAEADSEALRPWQGVRPSMMQALQRSGSDLPAVVAEYRIESFNNSLA